MVGMFITLSKIFWDRKFFKRVNSFQPITIFVKASILDDKEVFNILLIIIELFILELRKFEEEIIQRFLDLLALKLKIKPKRKIPLKW